MDARLILWLLVGVVVFGYTGTQRTYRRTCDCEYMVDGRCAYTLLLPAGDGRTPVCPSREGDTKDESSQGGSEHLMRLRENITNLSRWSEEQARLLSQLQGLVLSQQQIIDGMSSSRMSQPTTPVPDGSSTQSSCAGCDSLAVEISGHKTALEALEVEVRQQVTSMAVVQAKAAAYETLIETATKLASQQLSQQQNLTLQVMKQMSMLQVNISRLNAEYFLCMRKGLLVSGPVMSIPDDMITASSTFNPGHAATRGRIFTTQNGTAMGAWCAREPNDDEEWLQFDLGKPKSIYGVITRGRSDYTQWVTKYKVKYTIDDPIIPDTKWMTYDDVLGMEQMFEGNIDQDTPKTNMLWQPIRARYIRIIPTASSSDSNKCMRADVIGCMDEQ